MLLPHIPHRLYELTSNRTLFPPRELPPFLKTRDMDLKNCNYIGSHSTTPCQGRRRLNFPFELASLESARLLGKKSGEGVGWEKWRALKGQESRHGILEDFDSTALPAHSSLFVLDDSAAAKETYLEQVGENLQLPPAGPGW